MCSSLPFLLGSGGENGHRRARLLAEAELGGVELPLQVCRAPSGIFYIGTLTPEGLGFGREGIEYWGTREEAARAFKAGRPAWTQKPEP